MSSHQHKRGHVFETGTAALALLEHAVAQDTQGATRVIEEAPCPACLTQAFTGLLMSMEPWGRDLADRAWMSEMIDFARSRLNAYHRALS